MSSKFIAAMSVTAAVFLSAAVFSVSSVQAQGRPGGATAIIKCLYLTNAGGGFMTRVGGVETAGGLDDRLAEALARDMSCAEAYNLLADAGFALVPTCAKPVPSSNGTVDAADYVVWRKSGPF